jgi:hypothetical protein
MKLTEDHFGADHPDMLVPLNGIGTLLADQGRYREAKPWLERALTLVEKVAGNDISVRRLDGLVPPSAVVVLHGVV